MVQHQANDRHSPYKSCIQFSLSACLLVCDGLVTAVFQHMAELLIGCYAAHQCSRIDMGRCIVGRGTALELVSTEATGKIRYTTWLGACLH